MHQKTVVMGLQLPNWWQSEDAPSISMGSPQGCVLSPLMYTF